MAYFSELAYLRFNPLFRDGTTQDWFVERVSELIDDKQKSSLIKLIDLIAYDAEEEKDALQRSLNEIGYRLEDVFDSHGTQAFLTSCEDHLVLSFRGTEATSMKDIKSDLKATTMLCSSGGKIHTGFSEAFDVVKQEIKSKLNDPQYAAKPLYITGHSLGGALATVAAKKLHHSAGTAACYTFGAPRVGDDEWISTIKTPVYGATRFSGELMTFNGPALSFERLEKVAIKGTVEHCRGPFRCGWLKH